MIGYIQQQWTFPGCIVHQKSTRKGTHCVPSWNTRALFDTGLLALWQTYWLQSWAKVNTTWIIPKTSPKTWSLSWWRKTKCSSPMTWCPFSLTRLYSPSDPGTVGRGQITSHKNMPCSRGYCGLIEVPSHNNLLFVQGCYIKYTNRSSVPLWEVQFPHFWSTCSWNGWRSRPSPQYMLNAN